MTEHAQATRAAGRVQPENETRRRRPRPRASLIIVLAAVLVVAVSAAVVGFVIGTENHAKQKLTVGMILEPRSLDIRQSSDVAAGQILIDNVYQGLLGIVPGTVDEIRPVLAAELPEVSEDGREYTFRIREGVTFHSGEALETADVVASLHETLTPELLDTAIDIVEVGARTVRISLAEPNNQLPWHLANREGLIINGDATNAPATSAVGTGPYRFESWQRGESLTLVKNEDYWGEEATLQTAVFRFLPERKNAVRALKEGQLDVHTAMLPSLRSEFENRDDFTLVRAASTDVFTLAFNSQREPLDDVRVREAISLAIDTEAVLASQNGDGKPLSSPITESESGYIDPTGANVYDPDAARELLEEAGQSGLSLTLTAPGHYDSAATDIITSQLAEVGVSITLREVSFSTWREEVYENHDFQLSYVDHAGARDLANYANPDYYFGYDSERVQELYAEAIKTTDPEEADALLTEVARQLGADIPAKWLFNYTPTNVVGVHVSGFPEENTNSRIVLEGVRIVE